MKWTEMGVDELSQLASLSIEEREEVAAFVAAATSLGSPFAVDAVRFAATSHAQMRAPDTSSEQFQEWFGESVIVDGDGGPLRLFHGTTQSFSMFRPSATGSFGAGVYLTPDPSTAELFGDGEDGQNVMPLFVRMERPYHYRVSDEDAEGLLSTSLLYEVFDAQVADEIIAEERFDMDDRLSETLMDLGHDGIIVTYPDGGREYLVFSAGQVKSALSNTGSFDAFDDDIMFQRRRPEPRANPALLTWDDGTARRCFHGTATDFDDFAVSNGWFGRGVYFTSCPDTAGDYANDAAEEGGNARIIPAYVRLDNPYYFTEHATNDASNVQLMRELGMSAARIDRLIGDESKTAMAITAALEQRGFDGLIAQLLGEPPEVIVFSPEQVQYPFDSTVSEYEQNGTVEKPNAFGVSLDHVFGLRNDDQSQDADDIADRSLSQREAELGAVEGMASLFGSSVAYYKSSGAKRFNGAKLGGRIWIDVDADRPLHTVFGHELLHVMKDERPDLYEGLQGVLRPLLMGTHEYGRLLGLDGRSRAYIEEEMIADVFADRFAEPSFWRQVAARQPTLVEGITAFVSKWLTRIAASVRTTTLRAGDRFVRDVDAAREAIAQVVASYAANRLCATDAGLMETLGRKSSLLVAMHPPHEAAALAELVNDVDDELRSIHARHVGARSTYDAVYEWVLSVAADGQVHPAHAELTAVAVKRGHLAVPGRPVVGIGAGASTARETRLVQADTARPSEP